MLHPFPTPLRPRAFRLKYAINTRTMRKCRKPYSTSCNQQPSFHCFSHADGVETAEDEGHVAMWSFGVEGGQLYGGLSKLWSLFESLLL